MSNTNILGQNYNHIANQNKIANVANLKKWVESFTPDQIRVANNARKLLRKKGTSARVPALIPDERQPKRPVPAHSFYLQERYETGDFKGIKLAEAAGIILNEWKSLSTSEKQVRDRNALASDSHADYKLGLRGQSRRATTAIPTRGEDRLRPRSAGQEVDIERS